MNQIPIYNAEGSVVDLINIHDDITYVSGRTSKGTKLFYKGIGCNYKQHATINPDKTHRRIGPNPVWYYGSDVVNNKWVGLFGIFQDRFQPYFSDWIGCCGPKERTILINSSFTRSAISVEDCVDVDKEKNQSYYIINYIKPRDSFIESGNIKDLVNLMDVMLEEHWNFPWDKASIRDVNSCGYVTDVADMFRSSEINHKFGTIYSLLYSLFLLSKNQYQQFLRTMGLPLLGLEHLPFVVTTILEMHNIRCKPPVEFKSRTHAYIHLIGNMLLRGRNCASVEDRKSGDAVMLQYVNRFAKQLHERDRSILEP